jgi:hypothetical protein
MVKMDEFLATRMFFLGPNFAKNRPEVKKNSPSGEIPPAKKTLVYGFIQQVKARVYTVYHILYSISIKKEKMNKEVSAVYI